MVASAWVFTLLCASPQAIIFRVLKHPTKEFYQCTTIDFFEDLAEKHFNLETNQTEYILGGINTEAWHTIYHTVVNTQIFFLPLLIIVISYIKIYSILSQSVYTLPMTRVELGKVYFIRLIKSVHEVVSV